MGLCLYLLNFKRCTTEVSGKISYRRRRLDGSLDVETIDSVSKSKALVVVVYSTPFI